MTTDDSIWVIIEEIQHIGSSVSVVFSGENSEDLATRYILARYNQLRHDFYLNNWRKSANTHYDKYTTSVTTPSGYTRYRALQVSVHTDWSESFVNVTYNPN